MTGLGLFGTKANFVGSYQFKHPIYGRDHHQ